MRAPGITYRFNVPTDVAGPTLELFSRNANNADTAVSVAVNLPGVAKDRILFLTNIIMDLIPGATQAVTRASIVITTPAMLAFQISNDAFPVVADLRRGHLWTGDVAVGGGGVEVTTISMTGTFDAGVASNTVSVGVFGYVIPRGNIAPY